ncbi:MAG: hypothetical protein ACYTGG_00805 [Planctomycetota bacterium]
MRSHARARPAVAPGSRTRTRSGRRRLAARLVLVLAALLSGRLAAFASDTVVMEDRRRFHGVIVAEDEDSVTMELIRSGAMMRVRLPRAEIQTIEYVDRAGPSYCVLPLTGPIGQDVAAAHFVTAPAFRAALEAARESGVDYVVLLIDSRGGSIDETEAIIDAIAEAGELKLVAYVREAVSAAAVIAMACPDIIMAPQGVIGAAVPYQQTPDGTPKSIEEKMQSAVRAGCRAAAELGGHSSLLMRGMMEPDLELALVPTDDGPRVVEAASAPGARIIKPRGQILTLTPTESVECGLASGVTASISAIAPLLGHPSWHATDDRPWFRIVNAAKTQRRVELERRREERILAVRKAYLDEIRPELSRIDARLAQLKARIKTVKEAEAALKKQTDADLAAAESAYRRAKAEAESSDNPFYFSSRATNVYTLKIASIRRDWKKESARLLESRKEAEYEAEQLTTRRNELLSKIPTGE